VPSCASSAGRSIDEHSTGMRVAGFGQGTSHASCPAGVSREDQPQAFQPLSEIIDTCAVSACSHRGDGYGALDATQGLECLDDRIEPPGFDLVLVFLFETPQALGHLRGCG
jgi:hypothetical protein